MTVYSAQPHSRSRIPGLIDPKATYAFRPDDLASLTRWFDATSTYMAATYSNGNTVGTWNDLSSNALDATQSTESNKPLYVVNVVNGRNAINFYDTSDYMDFGTFSPSEYSYFVVWQRNATDDQVILTQSDLVYTYLQYTDDWYVGGGTTPASIAMAQDAFYLKEAVVDSTTVYRYTNGSAHSTQARAGTHGFRYIGLPGGFPVWGYIAEILIYSEALSSESRINVENYLMNKYGLT